MACHHTKDDMFLLFSYFIFNQHCLPSIPITTKNILKGIKQNMASRVELHVNLT